MIDLAEKLSLILFHLKTDISVVVDFYFQSKTFIRSIDRLLSFLRRHLVEKKIV
jgi:hypothetical protein